MGEKTMFGVKSLYIIIVMMLSGCAHGLQWQEPPRDMLTLDDTVAFSIRGDVAGQEVPINLSKAPLGMGNPNDLRLFRYDARKDLEEVHFRADGNVLFATLQPDVIYVLARRPDTIRAHAYKLACGWHFFARHLQPLEPPMIAGNGLIDPICTMILCSPERFRGEDLTNRFPTASGLPGMSPDELQGRSFGGFGPQPPGPGSVCDRCTKVGHGGSGGRLVVVEWAEPLPSIEIEINETPTEQDDYLTWAPTVSRIRLNPGCRSPVPDKVVVLTNDPPNDIPLGGDVLFALHQDPWPVNTTATSPTIQLTLPGNGNWVKFVVAGKFGKPSVNDKDAVIEVREGTAQGGLLKKMATMVRVRKNANSLTADERSRFLKAIRQLRNSGRFLMFQEMHRLAAADSLLNMDEGHGHPGFLPWHRALLLQVERELQAIDPAVTLPYWEWDLASPNMFSADFIGAGDTSSGAFLAEPIFAATNPLNGWTTDMGFSNGKIRRRTFDQTGNPGTGPNAVGYETLAGMLAANNYGPLTDSSSFSYREESNAHNVMHGWNCTGGHLIDAFRSASDPQFYLLHTQVDREWAYWQKVKDRQGTMSGGSVTFPDPSHYNPSGPWDAAGVTNWQKGSFLEDTLWPWDGDSLGAVGRGRRPANQGQVCSPAACPNNTQSRPLIPVTPFPQSSIKNLWPPAPTKIGVRDTIDYLGHYNPANGLGFAYDDVPY